MELLLGRQKAPLMVALLALGMGAPRGGEVLRLKAREWALQ